MDRTVLNLLDMTLMILGKRGKSVISRLEVKLKFSQIDVINS